jgi:phosphopantothenoylcysteine decarboxylase/phosphopantothenate--cysteine ligase
LQRKNLDLIILNSLNDAGAGFGHDTNRITVIDRNQQSHAFPLKSKKEAATDIIQLIIAKLYEKSLIQVASKDPEPAHPA